MPLGALFAVKIPSPLSPAAAGGGHMGIENRTGLAKEVEQLRVVEVFVHVQQLGLKKPKTTKKHKPKNAVKKHSR